MYKIELNLDFNIFAEKSFQFRSLEFSCHVIPHDMSRNMLKSP